MKSLLSDKSKFIQLNIDKIKCLNYIVHLGKKLREHLKTLESNNKKSQDEFKSMRPIGHSLAFCMDLLKSTIFWLITFPNFDLYFQLLVLLFINQQNYWFLFCHQPQLMTKVLKMHFPLLKELLILIIILLWQVQMLKRCLPTFL